MRTMTWEEIDKDWGGLQKKHRMEIAQAVARYCVGHKIKQVGERLGYSDTWVNQQLNFAGIGAAIGEGLKLLAPGVRESATDRAGVERAVEKVVKEFGPDIAVKMSGQGGSQKIAAIEGKDAKDFEPYLEHYLEQGHEPAAAIRLAKSEWAAESAVEAGVIKEDVNKRNEKVNRILFPDDAKNTIELDFKMHMARMEKAIRFLDECKLNFLRKKSTCEKVASIHEKWLEQVERILIDHQTFKKDV